MLKEFKEFALKGNMIDLAIGVIIGGAFNKIVTSLVNDIIMPALSFFTGKLDFSNYFLALDGKHYDKPISKLGSTATINYGTFISGVIDFLIMSFVVFIVVTIKLITAPPPNKKKKAPHHAPQKAFLKPFGLKDFLKKININAKRCFPHWTGFKAIKIYIIIYQIMFFLENLKL